MLELTVAHHALSAFFAGPIRTGYFIFWREYVQEKSEKSNGCSDGSIHYDPTGERGLGHGGSA